MNPINSLPFHSYHHLKCRFLIFGSNIVSCWFFLYGNLHMEHLDTCKLLFPVKLLKWPLVHINDVVFNLCKKTTIFFFVAFQFLVRYYIHYDVIKQPTTWYDTSRIIITYILLFQWIQNRATCQGNIILWREEFISKWW